MLKFIAFIFAVGSIQAQIPCDDAYGEFCPSASSWEVGDCLKQLQPPPSDSCLSFVKMHDDCKTDIETHCLGKEYTGDIVVCLTEWTKPENLSSTCLESLPKPAAKKERKLSDKEKKKAAARRKVRKEAEKLAREF
mmetsp:Transcript_32079/g.46237  ORF Transcript_32079/g.46237 Transcript_32079/m.46237 type:complete len:136 (+) Transcript_32079:3-410(+)